MSQFYNISRVEMDQFLVGLGFQLMSIPGTTELVYGKVLRHQDFTLSLRVYTAINPSGESRAKGIDAIRLKLYWRFENEPVHVGRTQNCKRVKNWRKNIQAAMDRVLDGEHFRICPNCHQPLVTREGQFGEFWACSTWFKTKCGGKKVVANGQ